MVELVDTYALGAYAARCAGSNPVPGTITAKHSMSVFLCMRFGPNGASPVPGTRILAISAHLGVFSVSLNGISRFSRRNRPTKRIVAKNFD